MKKISLILVFILCFSLTYSFATPSDWAVAEIEKANKYDLTTNSLTSNYQKSINREEFAELSVKVYEALSKKEAAPVSPNPFTDTNNPEILKANNLGIVSGVGSGRFAPEDTITREQIAVMFTRVLDALDMNPIVSMEYVQFTDEDEISEWAKSSIQLMNKLEILGGVGEGKIAPKGTATKEQAVALSVRTYEKFIEEERVLDKNIHNLDSLDKEAKTKILNEFIILPTSDYDSTIAQKMIDRISSIPTHILKTLVDKGAKMKLANNPITDEPEFAYLKGVTPRGWESTGKTWDDIPGAGGSYMTIARIGYSEPGRGHGAINLELHELSHTIDNYLGRISSSEEFQLIWKKEVKSVFGNNPYFVNYSEEYFAETMAMFYLGEDTKELLKNKAPLTYDFIDKLQKKASKISLVYNAAFLYPMKIFPS